MKILAIILAAIGALAPVVASGPDDEVDIQVREERGVYYVRADFDVPQAPDVALGVLKDYERLPRFMPDMRLSVVRERSGDRVVVEQEAVAKMLMFSRRVHLVLEIHEESGGFRFADVCGRSFSRYSGTWRVAATDGRTTMTYELTAQPSFSVPEFVLSRLLKRDAAQMIARLREEIAGRGEPSSGF